MTPPEDMVKVWLEDPARRIRADIRDIGVLKGLKLTLPLSLRARWPAVVIDVAPGPLPDYFECGVLKLMSDSLVSLLSRECNPDVEIEFLPVSVQQGTSSLSYSFGHVLESVDCIDRNESRFTTADGVIDVIEHLELKVDGTRGHRLFRIAETYEYVTCVDHALAEALSRETSGSLFVDPREWRW